MRKGGCRCRGADPSADQREEPKPGYRASADARAGDAQGIPRTGWIYKKLEKHYRDMQDIEFTIQSGTLWMLQTRSGKRTTQAAVRIAVEMAQERLISRSEALLRVDADSLDQLLHPTLDPTAERDLLAHGSSRIARCCRRDGRLLRRSRRGEGQGR